ncbi:helix-turn-helix domain-containing protein [Phenylobacterium immobile]|uniref:helix-turn-helix domain-containing protein n=1 Tax=Phenylobacterium immobile TaxID=21 RepID=UPI000B19398F|nr:helix-turn-helix domain-containing protein [Phenylobacterium immobile]
MKIDNLLTDEAVAAEMGVRLAQARIARAFTQAQLAAAAGVSKRTVERLEDGQPTQMAVLIRCLRALGLLENLERLLPAQPTNPMDLLRARRAPRQRVRSSAQVEHGVAEIPAKPWVWGDQR